MVCYNNNDIFFEKGGHLIATIKDVAVEAEVSVSLVSHYLNGRSGVGPKSRERIEAAIRKLNYRPNEIARSLVLQKTDTIGVVVSSLCNPFMFDLLNGMEEAAETSNPDKTYNVIYCSASGDPAKKQRYIKFFTNGRVDALLIYGSMQQDDELIENLSRTNFPFALIENDLPDVRADKVLIDNVEAGARATQYLYDLGHRRIAFFVGLTYLKITSDRQRGYELALRRNGLPLDESLILMPDYSEYVEHTPGQEQNDISKITRQEYFQAAYLSMKRFLDEGRQPPDAIFCSSDIYAYGAIKALQEKGLSVPENVSIIGFDDEKSYEFGLVVPPITTMRQPLHRAGYLGVEALMHRIEHPDASTKQIMLNAELIERGSCRRK